MHSKMYTSYAADNVNYMYVLSWLLNLVDLCTVPIKYQGDNNVTVPIYMGSFQSFYSGWGVAITLKLVWLFARQSWGDFVYHFIYMWKTTGWCCLILLCGSQCRQQNTIGLKKAVSHSLTITRDTELEKREELGQTRLFNVWTIGAMDRTSAQPEVMLNLLRTTVHMSL